MVEMITEAFTNIGSVHCKTARVNSASDPNLPFCAENVNTTEQKGDTTDSWMLSQDYKTPTSRKQKKY